MTGMQINVSDELMELLKQMEEITSLKRADIVSRFIEERTELLLECVLSLMELRVQFINEQIRKIREESESK